MLEHITEISPLWFSSTKNPFCQFPLIEWFLILSVSSNAFPSWAVTQDVWARTAGNFNIAECPLLHPATAGRFAMQVHSSWETGLGKTVQRPGSVQGWFCQERFICQGSGIPLWVLGLSDAQCCSPHRCPSSKQPACYFFKTALLPSCHHSISSVDTAPPVHPFLHKCFCRYFLVFYGFLLPFLLYQHWCLQLFSHIFPVLSPAAIVQFFFKWASPVVPPPLLLGSVLANTGSVH